ncbi:MAG: hypothetical protein PHW04_00785 [Candidatus Wallbacteria bacterium]|nr:hypothetical protein [Candidatus Wallbacteria bacterium]
MGKLLQQILTNLLGHKFGEWLDSHPEVINCVEFILIAGISLGCLIYIIRQFLV